jgi:predicted phage terminase large subunit-like protein
MAGNKRRRAAQKREARASAALAVEIKPQVGPQETFLSSSADIAIFGGSAGGGKTWAELLECLRHVDNPEFGAVIFRRTSKQITNEGGLWDESLKIYPLLGATPRESTHDWTFPSGCTVQMRHLQHEKNVHDWQGSQVALICFDELTHFTEKQFFYMLSRNRSMCGVRPYIRATCNPDADSWVAEFISWWIDQETGFAIPERSGVLRWMIRVNDTIHWADSRDELVERFNNLPGVENAIKSVTFIRSSIHDNKKLLEANPEYLGNLMSLPLVERARLLDGNWKIKPTAGKVFNRAWFILCDLNEVPAGGVECRFWDFAATAKQIKTTTRKPDPDYTAGVKIRFVGGRWYVIDVVAMQAGPAQVEKEFMRVTRDDLAEAIASGHRYKVRWEEEPGSASKRETMRLMRKLAGMDAKGVRARGDKLMRAKGLAVQAEHGNVSVVRGAHCEPFLTHMHGQPDLDHDDIMDGAAGAFTATVKEKANAKSSKKKIY